MLKMIEVVGISPVGFSEAVRDAVEKVTKSGQEAHFVEVMEQHGSVRDGKFREFQAKIKVAVDDRTLD